MKIPFIIYFLYVKKRIKIAHIKYNRYMMRRWNSVKRDMKSNMIYKLNSFSGLQIISAVKMKIIVFV